MRRCVNMEVDKVFKILTADQWSAFQEAGEFIGSPVDIQDGYIHLSTAVQTERVLNKYYADTRPVFIIEFQSKEIMDLLKWEKASNNDLFPHLYGRPLHLDEVSGTEKID